MRLQLNQEKANQKVEGMFEKCIQSNKNRIFFGGTMLNAKWLREHGSYTSSDFVKRISEYEGKVLAITGKADLSADSQSLQAFAGMNHVTCYTPEKVNHILREIDDNNSMMTAMKQYQRLSKKPIDEKVLEKLADWTRQFVTE